MEELKKVNEVPKFREYITEEQDKEFIINTLKKEARKEGYEIGYKESFEKGFKKGIFESKTQLAKNMLKLKYSFDTISEYTNLSTKEIKSIRI